MCSSLIYEISLRGGLPVRRHGGRPGGDTGRRGPGAGRRLARPRLGAPASPRRCTTCTRAASRASSAFNVAYAGAQGGPVDHAAAMASSGVWYWELFSRGGRRGAAGCGRRRRTSCLISCTTRNAWPLALCARGGLREGAGGEGRGVQDQEEGGMLPGR